MHPRTELSRQLGGILLALRESYYAGNFTVFDHFANEYRRLAGGPPSIGDRRLDLAEIGDHFMQFAAPPPIFGRTDPKDAKIEELTNKLTETERLYDLALEENLRLRHMLKGPR